jgi:hypothetical protein
MNERYCGNGQKASLQTCFRLLLLCVSVDLIYASPERYDG